MTDLDTELTGVLNRRALGPSVSAPPISAIAARSKRQSRRRVAKAGVAAVTLSAAVGGVALVGTRGHTSDPVVASESTLGTSDGSEPVAVASESTLRAVDVSLPGWSLQNEIRRDDDGVDFVEYVEYQFSQADRRLQISFYAGDIVDARLNSGRGAPFTTVALRTTTGYVPYEYPMSGIPRGQMDDVGPGVTRIVWREGGWSIEANGAGIGTNEELILLLDQLELFSQ